MGRIGLAFQTFFGILFSQEVADRIANATKSPAIEAQEAPKPAAVEPPPKPVAPPKPLRSDALTLLEVMQREARFLDFVQESLDDYDDSQVGAAVREIHRGCHDVLGRLFELRPVLDVEEGASFEVTANHSAARVRLTGRVRDERPLSGQVMHSGWRASKCELPSWTGAKEDSQVIAPAEVEVS
ncbi:MAG: DUF2760 domain-containing protein [Planctomycetaceae bacterium]|nr:DUF2760 domain-containing protein [Planctomycetaceae bacterium]